MSAWDFYESYRRHGIPTMESLDFIRALNERPTWAKMMFRLVVGRYAYREFLFMVKNIRCQGYEPLGEYGLNDADYHADEQPWLWWHERSGDDRE